MKKNSIKTDDYIFLSAMIRAREAGMLTDEKLQQAINAGSASDAARIFAECGYPDMSEMSDAEIDSALTSYRAAILDELSERPESKPLCDIFRMRYDYHNVKVLAKSMGENIDGGHALSPSGRIAPDRMTDAFISGMRDELPPYVAEAMGEAVGILRRTENPQLSDFAVDRLYFREMREHADKTGSELVKSYVSLLIDSANLRSAVRTLRMGRGQELLSMALCPGGTVDVSEYASLTPEGGGLTGLFGNTVLAKAAALGAGVVVGGSMTEFELAVDDAAAELLSSTKYVTYGQETVLNYLCAVEAGITAVRMIMAGKLYGIDPEVIRERMRRSYV